jgi:hypothetical protein
MYSRSLKKINKCSFFLKERKEGRRYFVIRPGGGGGFKKGDGAVSNDRGKVLVFYLSLLVL